MGMEAVYRRLSAAEFQEIREDPMKSQEFMHPSLPGFDMESMTELLKDTELLEAKGADLLAAFENRFEDPTRVDLQKEWHALHFLLTDESEMDSGHKSDSPLHNVVMGGHDTGIEASYGPARFFENEEVKMIAGELKKISVDDLRSRFSSEAFNREKIYPNPRPGGWTMEELEGLLSIYPKLVRFFEDASVSKEIVVVYLE
jgi:Domain of unknown function (DUF1877)